MKLFVLVDYQNDFVNEDVLGFPGAKVLDERLAKEIKEKAGKPDWAIAVTYDTHGESYLSSREGKHLPVKHTIFQTDGWKLYGETGKVIQKVRDRHHLCELYKKAFGLTPRNLGELKAYLMGRYDCDVDDITEIHFGGVVSNMCVLSVAVTLQAEFHNAEFYVDEHLIAGFDKETHKAALKVMEGLQMNVKRK